MKKHEIAFANRKIKLEKLEDPTVYNIWELKNGNYNLKLFKYNCHYTISNCTAANFDLELQYAFIDNSIILVNVIFQFPNNKPILSVKDACQYINKFEPCELQKLQDFVDDDLKLCAKDYESKLNEANLLKFQKKIQQLCNKYNANIEAVTSYDSSDADIKISIADSTKVITSGFNPD